MNDTSKYLIYFLCDPDTGYIRYVGKSTSGIERAYSHAYPSILKREAHTHKARWIQKLKRERKFYKIYLIKGDFKSHLELKWHERFYIAYLRLLGCDLLNVTSGGDGEIWTERLKPRPPISEETREKMRLASLGQKRALGHKKSEESKAKSRERMLGKVHSEETKAKMRQAHAEHNVWLGRKHTPEAIEKQREAHKGNQAHAKPVIDDLGNIFKSGKSAADFYKTSVMTISNSIRKGLLVPSIGGRQFFRYNANL